MREMFVHALLLVLLVSFVMPVRPGVASSAQAGGEDAVDEIIQDFEADAPADDNLEDLMEGFEDESALGEPAVEEACGMAHVSESSSWGLDGELAFAVIHSISSGVQSPWDGFSMVRPEFTLTLNSKFSDQWRSKVSVRGFYDVVYSLRGRHKYTDQVLHDYEKELELKDAYVQGALKDHLDVKIGRQVVVWGGFDNLRVVDVLNPLDLRVPGLTDMDDLRLPVTAIKLDYYLAAWDLSAMAIPEVRFSKMPVYGSDFYPYAAPLPPEDEPNDGFRNVPYAISMTGVFSGWDVGLYWADIYDDQIYLAAVADGPPGRFSSKHARVSMLGAAGSLAVGDWLFKSEVAWIDGLHYSNTRAEAYHRLDLGAGAEYFGFKETVICLEAVNRHIYDYDSRLQSSPDQVDRDEFQWAFRVTKDLIHDTLTLTCLISTFGVKTDNGLYERIEAEYDVTDAVGIRAGMVFYQAGDKEWFKDVEKNDRLFVTLTYHF